MHRYYSRRSSVLLTILDLLRELVQKVESANDLLLALNVDSKGLSFQKDIAGLWCLKCADDFFRENYSIDDVLVIYEYNIPGDGVPAFLISKELHKEMQEIKNRNREEVA